MSFECIIHRLAAIIIIDLQFLMALAVSLVFTYILEVS